MTLIFVALGWLAGLWLGQISSAGTERTALLQQTEAQLFGLVLLAGVAALLGRDDRGLRVTALAVGFALLGIWRAFSAAPELDSLAMKTGSIALRGTVASRPEPRDAALLLTVDVDEVRSGDSWERVRSRVLVRTDRYAEWAYGDRVAVFGEARPTGSGFWAEYLARQGIHTTLEYPSLRLQSRPSGLDLRRSIDAVRSRLESICATLFPEPQASLLAGILVGARASMPTDFRDALNITSTSHIVAVSGFNVTVVAGVAQLAALRFLARRKATLLAIVAVWLYSVLTGLPPSALRAAIMGTMALSAILVGRGGDALSFLCLSAAIMAGLDPLLLYDLGFQLSFLATAGLVLLEPLLRKRLGRLPGWLASSFSVTLAAQLTTLPVLVSNFHLLSLVSPLSNLLIAPMLPALMGFGALAVVLGAIAQPLGEMAAPVAWLYLTYLVEVIRWTARLPAAAVSTGGLGLAPVAIYYLLLLGVASWPMPEMRQARAAISALSRRAPRWALVGTATAGLSLGALALSGLPDGKVHVYFLDVGHGDATLIRSAEGHYVLVDGGPSPLSITSTLGRRVGFLDRRLDAVVLTGYTEDRLAGLLEVARRHPIDMVLQPPLPEDRRATRAWTELVRERGFTVIQGAPRQRIDLGKDAWLEVLWAPTGPSEDQAGALALKLVASGRTVLLMGDLPRAAQAELARESPGRVDVLRVPRNGAAGALDERFLQMVSPRVAVVSVRAGNRLGHPADSTLEMLRGAALFRTDRHGTVELAIGQEGYELFTER